MIDRASRVRLTLGRCSLAFVIMVCGSLIRTVAHAQGSVSYEVRQQVAGVILPTHDYDVSGTCATGTGVAPVSVYAQGGSGGGAGLGAGVGGRIGYQYAAGARRERGLTWWGFRAGSGVDFNLLYARVPTGIADMSGKLCARVKADGTEVHYQGSSVLLMQIPFFLGAELGLPTERDNAGRHGIVLGAAWAPAISYIAPWVGSGDLSASYLGAELTLDFATVHPGTTQESRKRVALFILLPAQDNGPVIMTLGFGAVWQ